jgi:hypothetical protein
LISGLPARLTAALLGDRLVHREQGVGERCGGPQLFHRVVEGDEVRGLDLPGQIVMGRSLR